MTVQIEAVRTRWQNAAGGQAVLSPGSVPGSSSRGKLRRSIQAVAASVTSTSSMEVAAAGLSSTMALCRFGRRFWFEAAPS